MKKYAIVLGLPLLCLLVLAGCKAPNPEGREDVTGKITLNGKPLENGYIIFQPDAAQSAMQGDGGGGPVNAGEYHLTGQFGIKPGEYTVVLRQAIDYDAKTGEPATLETSLGDTVPCQMLPAEFNRASKIRFTVVKGKKNVFDYEINCEVVPLLTSGQPFQKR